MSSADEAHASGFAPRIQGAIFATVILLLPKLWRGGPAKKLPGKEEGKAKESPSPTPLPPSVIKANGEAAIKANGEAAHHVPHHPGHFPEEQPHKIPLRVAPPPLARTLHDVIGHTPLIVLRSLSKATGCRILGKAEYLNPGKGARVMGRGCTPNAQTTYITRGAGGKILRGDLVLSGAFYKGLRPNALTWGL